MGLCALLLCIGFLFNSSSVSRAEKPAASHMSEKTAGIFRTFGNDADEKTGPVVKSLDDGSFLFLNSGDNKE